MNEQYTKALERADRLGVKIVGRGRWTSGAALFLVSSASTPAQPRIVTVDGSHETCNCPAQTICTHVAVVRRQLTQDAEETAAHLERVRRSMEQDRTSEILSRVSASLDAADARDAARKAEAAAKRDTSSVYRSNAPVSIWASA